jgi:hypothetical protein
VSSISNPITSEGQALLKKEGLREGKKERKGGQNTKGKARGRHSSKEDTYFSDFVKDQLSKRVYSATLLRGS